MVGVVMRVVGRAHLARQCASGRKSKLGARLRTREITTAALKALRCSALVWQNCVLFHCWLHDKLLGRCPKPYQRRCLWTPQGGSPLDPSARLSWSHSLNSSACLSSFGLLYNNSLTIIIIPQLHLLQIRHLLPQNRHIPQGHIRNPIILPIPRQSRCRHFPIQRPKHRQAINQHRSEERRVGKECRSRWSPYH